MSTGKTQGSAATLFAALAALVLGVTTAAGSGGIAPPTASGFAAVLASSTESLGELGRIERADCVEPKPGRYMCSYELRFSPSSAECHLVQASWTPGRSSLFTVTLAGRTRSCANLKDALHSLG